MGSTPERPALGPTVAGSTEVTGGSDRPAATGRDRRVLDADLDAFYA
jgi:hypothetical protein